MANARGAHSTNGLSSDGSLMNVGNHIWDPANGGKPSVRLYPEYSSGSAMAALLTDEGMGIDPHLETSKEEKAMLQASDVKTATQAELPIAPQAFVHGGEQGVEYSGEEQPESEFASTGKTQQDVLEPAFEDSGKTQQEELDTSPKAVLHETTNPAEEHSDTLAKSAHHEVANSSETMRAELDGMKNGALRKRAAAAGAAEEALEAADDADDTKGALIELILAGQEARKQALRGELEGMKNGALRKRAAAAGVGEEALEAADDADDTKGALIELILTAKGGAAQVGKDHLESDLAGSTGTKHEQSDTSANAAAGSGSVFGRPGHQAPHMVTCHICGKEFGHRSINIHVKQCERKWVEIEAQKPPKQRRPVPRRPETEDEARVAGTVAAKDRVQSCGSTSGGQQDGEKVRGSRSESDVADSNKSQQEQSEAAATSDAGSGGMFGKRHAPRMVACHICGKEFGHSSIKIHEKQCERRWVEAEARKPSKQRRPLPQKPKPGWDATQPSQDSSLSHEAEKDNSDKKEIEKDGENPQESEASAEAGGGHGVFGKRHAPRMVACYICGKEFGHSSIKIHEKQCARKWEEVEAQKPPQHRRPLPERPKAEDVTASGGKEHADVAKRRNSRGGNLASCDEGAENTSNPVNSAPSKPATCDGAETREGFGKRHNSHMVTCYICGREFGHSSIKIHEKQCAQKWERIEAQKPVQERRPLPLRPEEGENSSLPQKGPHTATALHDEGSAEEKMLRMELAASDWCLVHKLFGCMDADSSGTISHEEFLVAMHRFGRVGESMEFQVDWSFERMDSDHSGDVDFAEFLQALQPMQSMLGVRKFQKILESLISSTTPEVQADADTHAAHVISDITQDMAGLMREVEKQERQANGSTDPEPGEDVPLALVQEISKACGSGSTHPEPGEDAPTALVKEVVEDCGSLQQDAIQSDNAQQGEDDSPLLEDASPASHSVSVLEVRAQQGEEDSPRLEDASPASHSVSVLEHSDTLAKPAHQEVAKASETMRAELEGMKKGALRKRAAAAGAAEEELEAADDADDIRGALIELILARQDARKEAALAQQVEEESLLPGNASEATKSTALQEQIRRDVEPVFVFGRDDCSRCRLTGAVLADAGIAYERKDIDADKSYELALDASGFEGGRFGLPVVVFSGSALWDFDVKQLPNMLKAKGMVGVPPKRNLRVYGAEDCSNCQEVFKVLQAAGMSYEKHDASSDNTYEVALHASGFSAGKFSLPVVTWGLHAWWNVNPQKLMSQLQEVLGAEHM